MGKFGSIGGHLPVLSYSKYYLCLPVKVRDFAESGRVCHGPVDNGDGTDLANTTFGKTSILGKVFPTTPSATRAFSSLSRYRAAKGSNTPVRAHALARYSQERVGRADVPCLHSLPKSSRCSNSHSSLRFGFLLDEDSSTVHEDDSTSCHYCCVILDGYA